MKRIFSLVIFGLMLFTLSAQTFTEDGVKYKVTGTNTVEVTAGNLLDGDVVIPATVSNSGKTYNVTALGENAFTFSKMSSIQLPGSLTKIDKLAFDHCTGLTSLEIPASVKEIGESAFQGCEFTQLELPEGIKTAKDGLFAYSGIPAITLSPDMIKIEHFAFFSNRALRVVRIPEGVTEIGNFAFQNCSNMTSLLIPASVNKIGAEAFGFNNSLEELIVDSDTPMNINGLTFRDVDFNNCTLYVPVGKVNTYKNANYWKNFKVIKEIQMGTSTQDNRINNISIYAAGGRIVVDGEIENQTVALYDLKGSMLQSSKATGNRIELNAARGNIYIVKVGNESFKVIK